MHLIPRSLFFFFFYDVATRGAFVVIELIDDARRENAFGLMMSLQIC